MEHATIEPTTKAPASQILEIVSFLNRFFPRNMPTMNQSDNVAIVSEISEICK